MGLNEIKSRKFYMELPTEIQLLLKFMRWVDWDMIKTGNATSYHEYFEMGQWVEDYLYEHYNTRENPAPKTKDATAFSFAMYFATHFHKDSLRAMKENVPFDTYELAVRRIDNMSKYAIVEKKMVVKKELLEGCVYE